VNKLGKEALATPIYLPIAWTLMISYQLFTQTAVTTVVTQIKTLTPTIGSWLFSQLDVVIFVYAFAWVFLLSSALPSVILGRERSILIQFLVCLALTLGAFASLNALEILTGVSPDRLLNLSFLFNNPVLAAVYLSLPYVIMLMLDLRSRKKKKRKVSLAVADFETAKIELPNK
jgi:hypothetical protein